MTLFADRALAVRIESLCAEETRAFATASAALYPEFAAAWLTVGDGIAGYCGPDSAGNGTSGLGLAQAITVDDIVAVERFFLDRRARPVVNVCPLADVSLLRALSLRGWVLGGFENVFARELTLGEELPPSDPGVEVRLARTGDELLQWASLVVEGFSAPDEPTPAEVRLGRTAVAVGDRQFLTALIDGEPAGTAELRIADGVGWLSADTTLPRFRKRGVQRSLQLARLAMALSAGCDVAVTESAPGSGSQRNMERAGFRLVYTRVDMAGPVPEPRA